jgi:hypothetical protein
MSNFNPKTHARFPAGVVRCIHIVPGTREYIIRNKSTLRTGFGWSVVELTIKGETRCVSAHTEAEQLPASNTKMWLESDGEIIAKKGPATKNGDACGDDGVPESEPLYRPV